MRSRTEDTEPRVALASRIGSAAVTLALIPAVALGITPEVPPAATVAADDADVLSGKQVTERLVALEAAADSAGVESQIANEAFVSDPSAVTRAAVEASAAELESLAVEQGPERKQLIQALTAAEGTDLVEGEVPLTATTVALTATTRATKAVTFARKQIGDQYGFAKAGPGSWDCSGLTMGSYRAAGVNVGGHGATAQWRKASAQGRLVSFAKKRRGDLIFYGRPGSVYHVTIYSGHGRMIEAPYPGKRVREVPVRHGDRLAQVARPAR